MKRIILTFGVISGVIIIGSAIWSIELVDPSGESLAALEWLGYLIMLIALSVIFIGIKKYRDQELGGVITFGTALLVGVGISAVASVIYVGVWEIYLAQTNHAFMNEYIAVEIGKQKASGLTGAELDAAIAALESTRESYINNPLFRVAITLTEIFPVGLLISLVSAAILRRSEVLPAS